MVVYLFSLGICSLCLSFCLFFVASPFPHVFSLFSPRYFVSTKYVAFEQIMANVFYSTFLNVFKIFAAFVTFFCVFVYFLHFFLERFFTFMA